MSNLIIAEETITALDNAVKNGVLAQTEANAFKKMALIAHSIKELKSILTPQVMTPIMELQNSPLGFKTDKAKTGGYPVDVVRDCVISATLQGVFPVGNEFNIIAGQTYITKEGFGHKLRDIQGLSYSMTPSIPVSKNGGAIVSMAINWTYNGKKGSQDLELAIKTDSYTGTDAILGKAKRKARAWLYENITGIEVGDSDADDIIDIKAEDAKSPFEEAPKAESGDLLNMD